MKLLSYLLLDAVVVAIVFYVLWHIAKKLIASVNTMTKLVQNQRVKSAARAQGSCAIRVVQPRTDDLQAPVHSPFPETVDWSQYDVPTYFRRMINGSVMCRVLAPAPEAETGTCATA